MVLLVDDEVDFCRLMAEKLAGDLRREVRAATSFEDGLKQAEERRPNVIVVDFHLGRGTGLQLLDRVRAPGYAPLAIVISSDVDRQVWMQAANAHVFGVVEKPLKYPQLFCVVNEAVQEAGRLLVPLDSRPIPSGLARRFALLTSDVFNVHVPLGHRKPGRHLTLLRGKKVE